MSRSKGKVCSVENCENEAVRSLSIEKAGEALSLAGLSYKTSRRRILLCKEHYKAIKKQLKKAQKEERLRLTGGRPF